MLGRTRIIISTKGWYSILETITLLAAALVLTDADKDIGLKLIAIVLGILILELIIRNNGNSRKRMF